MQIYLGMLVEPREVRHQLGNIYEDLRGMQNLIYQYGLHHRQNRSSLEEEVIDASKV